ncbi:MAG TPA: hypothetical protein VFQ67_05185 [Allosphingosinicella sp.]|jgi:hypothetical protein|nr:hypothetical protein [Allosphingosinicella sp.]
MTTRAASLLLLPAALLATAHAAAQAPATADPDGGWATYMEIKKLDPALAAHPERATMKGPSAGWTLWPKAPPLPKELRRRVFVNESILLVDADATGKATACRPLRPSALPRLDAESCKLMSRPGYFFVDLIPSARPTPPQQVVIGVRWRRVDPETARRDAAKPWPSIVVSPPPRPPEKK